LHHFQAWFAVPVQQLGAKLAVATPENHLDGVGPVPLHVNQGHDLLRDNPPDLKAACQIFKLGHRSTQTVREKRVGILLILPDL